MKFALRHPFAVAGVAAAAALAVPGSASAAVTIDTSGGQIVFAGDGADDNLVLTVSGGKIAHNLPGFASPTDLDAGTAGTQDADVAGANIVVRGGGGNDNLNAAGLGNTYASLELQGEAGDDLITGGGGNDMLGGGDGDDRLVGAPGADTMSGGLGNDQLVWNNGDGSDVMNGDGGNDEVEVNGAPTAGDQFTIAPGAGDRTTFQRMNLGQFTLDTQAERMTVNGLGGNDQMTGAVGLAGRVLVTMNGGPGADALTGGDGADRLNGGEGADVLAGGAGDDRLAGDRGADQMRGGPGDDLLQWNDGDGSDTAIGEDGLDLVQVNGSVVGGDAFEVAPNGAGVRFQRTNLVPFTIDLEAEGIEINGLAGDDTIAARPGLAGRLAVLADGGSGNDRIEARNGATDTVRGGTGNDSAAVDRADVVTDVESIDRPARSRARVARKVTVRQRGARTIATFTVSCPAGAEAVCAGTLRLTTAKAVNIRGLRARVPLAERRYRVGPGKRAKVRVTLPKGVRAFAGRRGRLGVRAIVVSRENGALTESVRNLTLRLPRA